MGAVAMNHDNSYRDCSHLAAPNLKSIVIMFEIPKRVISYMPLLYCSVDWEVQQLSLSFILLFAFNNDRTQSNARKNPNVGICDIGDLSHQFSDHHVSYVPAFHIIHVES
jgi:hypothetical protein